MKIIFSLLWAPAGRIRPKDFKSAALEGALADYIERIGRYAPVETRGNETGVKNQGMKTWVCDRSKAAKMLSSEEIGEALERCMSGGTRILKIAIGGPDGFSKNEMELLAPDLRWCFGPMTLPHELAAVVAAEQIYRAWTIVRGLPYHKGH